MVAERIVISGIVKNGLVVPENKAPLPEGARVEIVLASPETPKPQAEFGAWERASEEARRPLKALLVMPTEKTTWLMEMDLPFPPFPGMGIRVDVYDMLNVKSVVIGDLGYDVTCIVEFEDTDASEITKKKCKSIGFHQGPYP
jgi:hypothetical protein